MCHPDTSILDLEHSIFKFMDLQQHFCLPGSQTFRLICGMLRAATSAARIRGFRRFGHQWPVTQVPGVHTRVFCAASYWEALKVGLEALRYSGEAIQKLQKFRSCKDELK
ncbi:unnamed protein product, partial [Effrenium voratum]